MAKEHDSNKQTPFINNISHCSINNFAPPKSPRASKAERMALFRGAQLIFVLRFDTMSAGVLFLRISLMPAVSTLLKLVGQLHQCIRRQLYKPCLQLSSSLWIGFSKVTSLCTSMKISLLSVTSILR